MKVKYKFPEVVAAMQYTGDNFEEIKQWVNSEAETVPVLIESFFGPGKKAVFQGDYIVDCGDYGFRVLTENRFKDTFEIIDGGEK